VSLAPPILWKSACENLVLTSRILFRYTKTAKSDDSVEHLSELGYITVTNLLPNQIYKDVLVPSTIHRSMPVDRQVRPAAEYLFYRNSLFYRLMCLANGWILIEFL